MILNICQDIHDNILVTIIPKRIPKLSNLYNLEIYLLISFNVSLVCFSRCLAHKFVIFYRKKVKVPIPNII